MKLRNLLSPECCICGSEATALPDGEFCPQCRKKLVFFSPDYRCNGCGGENRTIFPVCPQCLNEPPRPWQTARTIFAYQNFGKTVIHKFKFRRHSEIALPLGLLAAEVLKSAPVDCDFIVPIPLNFWKDLIRGFNQAELFAKVISRQTGIPFAGFLRSKLSFTSQRSRSREARHQAVKDKFQVRRPVPQGAKLLLVDDIFTTGSTLTAATELLLKSGAASVSVLTAARTLSAAEYTENKFLQLQLQSEKQNPALNS